MSRLPASLRFNYQDYLLLPEDRRYEIIDGDLYMVPAPVPYHQRVSLRLSVSSPLLPGLAIPQARVF